MLTLLRNELWEIRRFILDHFQNYTTPNDLLTSFLVEPVSDDPNLVLVNNTLTNINVDDIIRVMDKQNNRITFSVYNPIEYQTFIRLFGNHTIMHRIHVPYTSYRNDVGEDEPVFSLIQMIPDSSFDYQHLRTVLTDLNIRHNQNSNARFSTDIHFYSEKEYLRYKLLFQYSQQHRELSLPYINCGYFKTHSIGV